MSPVVFKVPWYAAMILAAIVVPKSFGQPTNSAFADYRTPVDLRVEIEADWPCDDLLPIEVAVGRLGIGDKQLDESKSVYEPQRLLTVYRSGKYSVSTHYPWGLSAPSVDEFPDAGNVVFVLFVRTRNETTLDYALSADQLGAGAVTVAVVWNDEFQECKPSLDFAK